MTEGRIERCQDVLDLIRVVKSGLAGEQSAELAQEEASLKRFWFRGQKCAEWGLEPKGLREGYKPKMQQMLIEFRAEAAQLCADPPDHNDLCGWLFLMQHYGMPTLLLDWTRSPLTALFFVLEYEKEAALWMLRPGGFNRVKTPQVTHGVIPEAYDYRLLPLVEYHFDAKRFDGRVTEPLGPASVVAIQPVYNTRRMIAQQSVFTMHGPDSDPLEGLMEVPQKNSGAKAWGRSASPSDVCIWKCTVPSASKARLRQELYDLGVHESTLFPDPDHLSRCIKNRRGLLGPDE